jgi:hypothetical protein
VLSSAVAGWATELVDVLRRYRGTEAHRETEMRRAMMDALGLAGERYRQATRESFDSTPIAVAGSVLAELMSVAIEHLDDSIATAHRSSGLYDSYNVVSFPNPGEALVGRLGPMLEGQVAVLASGALDAAQAVDVVEALYSSDIYRPDQNSFMLYPVRSLPAFLDRNTIPADDPELTLLAEDLIQCGALLRAEEGSFHFTPGMINAAVLAEALEGTSLDAVQRRSVLDRYELMFGHHQYTGRSGSMYGYEGIGSIYWHMVGKLLVAVQESYWRALDQRSDHVQALAESYRRIRAGLGFCKDPVTYGAIPTDCYSHTPSHSGAKQPGMTGQVKEEIITRFGELGLRVNRGAIFLQPGLLEIDQLVPSDSEAEFSYCETSFSIVRGSEPLTRVMRSGVWSEPRPGLELPRDVSGEILGRTGSVDSVEFTIPVAG